MADPEAILLLKLTDHPADVRDVLLATCAAVRRPAPGASELLFRTYVVGDLFTFTGKVGGRSSTSRRTRTT